MKEIKKATENVVLNSRYEEAFIKDTGYAKQCLCDIYAWKD